jgi:AcrR family transcriptional regulator
MRGGTVETRERILDAVVAITAERGLDQVSIREVASMAGVSIGTVQYYCRTKDDMLLLAMNHVNDRLVRRIDALEPAHNAVDRLCDVLRQWLPLDAERATDARVWLAFAARAVVNPRLGEVEAANTLQLRADIAGLLERGKAGGDVAPTVDSELQALTVLAVLDGLTIQLLHEPPSLTREQALAALTTLVTRGLT